MNILLTGGFSGGHIVPLIRLAQKINTHNYYYLGFEGFLEEKLATKANIPFIGLTKPNNKISYIINKKKRLNLLKEKLDPLKIDLVISTGGFHSFNGLSYAQELNIKYILIEENRKWGLVNLFFKRKAAKIVGTFPLRGTILGPNPSIYFPKIKKTPTYDILCLGGSLGSEPLIKEAIKISQHYKVIIIAGRYKEKYEKYEHDNCTILGFEDLTNFYGIAKITITRSGSSTLFELISLQSHFVTIPALKTKRNHQVHNAKFIHKMGLGLMLDEKKISIRTLKRALNYDFSKIEKNQLNYLKQFSHTYYEDLIDELKH